MKRNRMLMGLLVAAGVLGSSVAFAQSGQGGNRPPGGQGNAPSGAQMGGTDRGGPSGADGSRGMSAQPGERGGPSARDASGMPPGMAPGGQNTSASAYAYSPGQWKKGDRLPANYRDRQYVIDDWKSFQLERPPRGHQWVGIGNEFLLVSTRNGVIARVVTGQ